MILLSKVFLRLLNSFNAIFRQEVSTALQQKSHKRISRHSAVCLPFIGTNISLPVDDDQTFSVVISKVQNEQRILLFVHWKLVRES